MPKSELTAQEQLEYLATEIMEWEIIAHGPGYEDLHPIVKNATGYVTQHWNPLTDWNHWRQVEEKVMEDEDLWEEFAQHLFGNESCRIQLWLHMKADLPTRVSALISAHQELYPDAQ